MKKMYLVIIIILVNIMETNGYGKYDEDLGMMCSMPYDIKTKIALVSPEIKKILMKYHNKYAPKKVFTIYMPEGIIHLCLTFHIRTKEGAYVRLKKHYEQMLQYGEITKEEMQKRIESDLKKIPDSVKLFDKNIPFNKILKIYLIDERGKRIDITNGFELGKVDSNIIFSIKEPHITGVFLKVKKRGKLMKVKEGVYKINVVYDSRHINNNEIWKGYLEDEGCILDKRIAIVHPKNEVERLACKLNYLKYYYINGQLDKAIKLGEEIIRNNPGFYICYHYLSLLYDKKGNYKESYKNSKRFLEGIEYMHKKGMFTEKEWDEFCNDKRSIYCFHKRHLKHLEYYLRKNKKMENPKQSRSKL